MKTSTVLAFGLALLALCIPSMGSDHDDGERELKGRNLNLTDLYVFNEASQTGDMADKGNLILIMNTNPRSLPEQQYHFSTQARYSFHLSRVLDKASLPTARDRDTSRIDVYFSAPDKNNQQSMRVQLRQDGRWLNNQNRKQRVLTTNLADSQAGNLTVNSLRIAGYEVDVFAGHREDPFFFDVEQFFKVRGAAVKTGKLSLGFEPNEKARDFTKNYNVNSIVIRIPIALIAGRKPAKVFDVWETISVKGRGRRVVQIERLARPAVNEGLLITNSKLNAFNSIAPSSDLNTKNGTILGVLAEASASLDLFDSLDGVEHFANGFDSNVVKGFLPDVMRVDSSVVIAPGTAAYNGDFIINAAGAPMLTGGRKIEDDVIDITLSYLITGDVTGQTIKDNVSYQGYPGNNNQGHKKLHGQSTYNGAASFPFLAKPY